MVDSLSSVVSCSTSESQSTFSIIYALINVFFLALKKFSNTLVWPKLV
jgi:hypothetical protein